MGVSCGAALLRPSSFCSSSWRDPALTLAPALILFPLAHGDALFDLQAAGGEALGAFTLHSRVCVCVCVCVLGVGYWRSPTVSVTVVTWIRITGLVGLKSNYPFHVNTFARLCAVRLRSD